MNTPHPEAVSEALKWAKVQDPGENGHIGTLAAALRLSMGREERLRGEGI